MERVLPELPIPEKNLDAPYTYMLNDKTLTEIPNISMNKHNQVMGRLPYLSE